MKTIKNELISFWDVDQTVAMSAKPYEPGALKYQDVAGTMHWCKPHATHIDQLKKHKARGYTNILWSGNGWRHAEIIAELLGIKQYVDICMSKSTKHWDDLEDANQILTSRVYLEDK